MNTPLLERDGAHPSQVSDPVERVVDEALRSAGIAFHRPPGGPDLDFVLTESGVQIECKRMFTPRIAGQMERHKNVIVIQGLQAAETFAALITSRAYLTP